MTGNQKIKLVNLAPFNCKPRLVNPEQVDAVVDDDGETIVYAGQFVYRVRKNYTQVLEMLGAEVKEESE